MCARTRDGAAPRPSLSLDAHRREGTAGPGRASEGLRGSRFWLDEEDDAVLADGIRSADVLLRHAVDDLPRVVALDPFAHATADLRHGVTVGGFGHRDGDARILRDVSRLARPGTRQDGQLAVLDTDPHGDAVRTSVGKDGGDVRVARALRDR